MDAAFNMGGLDVKWNRLLFSGAAICAIVGCSSTPELAVDFANPAGAPIDTIRVTWPGVDLSSGGIYAPYDAQYFPIISDIPEMAHLHWESGGRGYDQDVEIKVHVPKHFSRTNLDLVFERVSPGSMRLRVIEKRKWPEPDKDVTIP